MRQFNAPPGWPDPPTARWRPPKNWQPAETWPPAPDGWPFWVDRNGKRVRGPLGRYGGPSRLGVAAIAAVPLALIGLVLVNPFGGHDSTTAGPSVSVASTVPTGAPRTSRTTAPTTAPTAGPTPTTETPSDSTETPTVQETTPPTSVPTPTPDPSSPSASTPVPEQTRTTPTETTTPTAVPTIAPATTSTTAFKTCAEARAAGKVPLRRGDPGYSAKLDHNGDGVACERGNS